MIKKRIIPLMLSQGNVLVKGKKFDDYRVVGKLESLLRIWSDQEVDELMVFDINAINSSENNFLELVKDASENVDFPLTVGGKVKTIEYARQLLQAGADKIAISSQAIENPNLISDLAREFGSQSVVVVADYRRINGEIQLFVNCGQSKTHLNFRKFIQIVQDKGAGELVLQSIDLDGTRIGLDLEILEEINDLISVPLILAGGAGNFAHLRDALAISKVSGVACGSLFYFGDNSPIRARSFLRNAAIEVRKSR